MLTVYVVLHDNYGDQGVDFHGVFASPEVAQRFIDEIEPNVEERQYWTIREEAVRDYFLNNVYNFRSKNNLTTDDK